MSIPDILNTYPGMYVTQSFLHSITASSIAAGAIWAWNIRDPLVKQRFRFALIIFPVFSFPAYQIIDPERGSALFRLGALFDSGRWLNMELWGTVPLHPFFLLPLFITAMIFILQELLPVVRHAVESKSSGLEGAPPSDGSPLGEALRSLPGNKPDVLIIDDEEMVLFSATGKNPVVYVSTGLVEELNEEQIKAALAHEIAHVTRSRRPALLLVFFLRMLLFYNPVALVEFRRAVRNEEKICDDIAVSITGKPLVLAETLKKFRSGRGELLSGDARRIPSMEQLDEYSHDLQLDSRIARLERGETDGKGGRWPLLVFVFIIISFFNYFVV